MKLFFIIFGFLLSGSYGKNLSKEESKALKSEVTEMIAAFEKGETELFLTKTHDSLKKLVGGEDQFREMLSEIIKAVTTSGIKFISTEFKEPTKLHIAGKEEICFLPKISVMEMGGDKMKSTSFLIAIRNIGSFEWKFLDGAGLRRNPDQVKNLLPELPEDIQFPENTIEKL